jgi:hypothetical protein
LQADCCDEYDPTFYHLRRPEHQHAMDMTQRFIICGVRNTNMLWIRLLG